MNCFVWNKSIKNKDDERNEKHWINGCLCFLLIDSSTTFSVLQIQIQFANHMREKREYSPFHDLMNFSREKDKIIAIVRYVKFRHVFILCWNLLFLFFSILHHRFLFYNPSSLEFSRISYHTHFLKITIIQCQWKKKTLKLTVTLFSFIDSLSFTRYPLLFRWKDSPSQ